MRISDWSSDVCSSDLTMAKTPEAAMGLMMKVWPAAVARVKEEVADMQAIADAEAKANKTPKITIEPWDYRFYAEKVRKDKYDLDERSEEHTSELQSLMRISYAVFYLKKKKHSET